MLALAEHNLRRLKHFAQHWPEESKGVIRLEDKIATEAALLLLIARRVAAVAGPVLEEPCDAIGDILASQIRNERLRRLLLTAPQTAATLGAGHVFLEASGFPDCTFSTLVQEALEANFAETVERVPYRLMDQRWTANLLRGPRRAFDDLLPYSILSSRAHPFTMTQSDAYAVTHAIMYLTDFGCAPLPAALDPARVAAAVEAGIAWHLLSEDFDLLIEYLLDAACLRLGPSPYVALAWQSVETVWEELGFLPGPVFDPAHYRRLEGEAADAYAFQTMYHTNLVAGLLCAVALLPAEERTPPPPPVAMASGSRLESLLVHVFSIHGTTVTPTAAWIRALPEVAPPEDELLRVVGDAALIEAVRREDRRALDVILADLRKWWIAETPTMAEAGWMRGRLERAWGLEGD